jgi:hypothetical protein
MVGVLACAVVTRNVQIKQGQNTGKFMDWLDFELVAPGAMAKFSLSAEQVVTKPDELTVGSLVAFYGLRATPPPGSHPLSPPALLHQHPAETRSVCGCV